MSNSSVQKDSTTKLLSFMSYEFIHLLMCQDKGVGGHFVIKYFQKLLPMYIRSMKMMKFLVKIRAHGVICFFLIVHQNLINNCYIICHVSLALLFHIVFVSRFVDDYDFA